VKATAVLRGGIQACVESIAKRFIYKLEHEDSDTTQQQNTSVRIMHIMLNRLLFVTSQTINTRL